MGQSGRDLADAGHNAHERYADPNSEIGRIQRFWLGQIYAAFVGYLGVSVVVLSYAALTWAQPRRDWIAGVTVAALVFAVGFYGFRHKIVTSRFRLAHFVSGSIAAFVLLAVLCGLDDGILSPISYLFILPMLYLALGYPLREAVYCGASGLATYALLVALATGPVPYLTLLLQSVALGLGYMLAIIGAFARDYKDRELERLRQKLEITAATDELTGCLNQRCFNEALAREAAHAARYGRLLALLVIDVDHFKHVNDRHGHMMGDEVLRRVGAALRDTARRSDIAGRPGGDELALLAPETGASAAVVVAERLRAIIAELPLPVNITLSIGVCAMIPDAEQPTMLFRRADYALYQAKRQGRNQIAVFDNGDSPNVTDPNSRAVMTAP